MKSSNKWLKDWQSPTNIVALASAAISLIAMIISVRSCVVTEATLRLADEEFKAARLPIYQGDVNDSTNVVVLQSSEPSIRLQQAKIYYPTEIDKGIWSAQPPKFDFHILVIKQAMQELLNKKVPKKAGFARFAPEASLPIVIESFYTARGKGFIDRSLYVLNFTYTVTDRQNELPIVHFIGLTFLQHLKSEDLPHAYLDDLWKSDGYSIHQDKSLSD